MSNQHESAESAEVEHDNFLLDTKDYSTSSKKTDAIATHLLNSHGASPFQTSATIASSPSPQLLPSPHSGPKSVPPCFPFSASQSPSFPTSPAVSCPTPNSYLARPCSTVPKSASPLQFHSDGESGYRVGRSRHGSRSLKDHTSPLRPILSRSNRTKSSTKSSCSRTLNLNSPLHKGNCFAVSQPEAQSDNRYLMSSPVGLFSLQPTNISQNPMPASGNATDSFLTSLSEMQQSHFLLQSPLAPDQKQCQQQFSPVPSLVQKSSTIPNAANTSCGTDPSVAAVLSEPVKSLSSAKQQYCLFSPGMDNLPATLPTSHSPDASPGAENAEDIKRDKEPLSCPNPADSILIISGTPVNTSQAPQLSFAQSYANLTPWTTRLITNSATSFPTLTDETMPLSLGITENLLLSTTAKENQPQPQPIYGLVHQPYSTLQPTPKESESPPRPAKESHKPVPNKQLRFKKTADALHKSGLWEVAMKTGSLIRRNRELQKELDKFRADALTFMKSVIKNPHNWNLIKSVLSNALSSNQVSSKSSPIMGVVVSAAAAAAAASVQYDSAGSTEGSSSVCGNASDSSGNSNSSSSDNSFVQSHFPTAERAFSCVGMAMDVN